MAIVLKVRGTPVPQGSMTCVGGPGRGHNVQPSNKLELLSWRNKIASACQQAIALGAVPFICHDPVRVDITYTLERPKTVTRDYPAVPPDEDKYRRAVLDGLTKGEIWNDDGQCIGGLNWKTYPHMSEDAPIPEDVLTDGTFGVVIRITAITANRLI